MNWEKLKKIFSGDKDVAMKESFGRKQPDIRKIQR